MWGERIIPFAVAVLILIPLEWRFGRGAVPLRSRVLGLTFWALATLAAVAITYLLSTLWHPPRVIRLPLSFEWAGIAAPVLTIIAVAIVADFWFYWFHRMQHRFLWRFHRVHHSIREMHATNANHHVSESLFNGLFLFIPASLIFWDYPLVPAGMLLRTLLSQYIHSPVDLDFGPLRSVLVDNRFHRIHHSLKPGHFDSNFGGFTTIWDRLFGTAYWPANDEWPAIGVEGVDEPQTVREWLSLPWR